MSQLTIAITIHNDYSHIHSLLDVLTAKDYKIYVTINTGEEPAFHDLKTAFPQVEYIINAQPKGFAENHNTVLRLAETPYVALLNDDIAVSIDDIETLINYMEQNPEIGLVSPRIVNPDGSAHLTSFNDPTLWRMMYKVSGLGHLTRQGSPIRNWLINSGMANQMKIASLSKNDTTLIVPVVVGVAMFVRREAYLKAGVLDEDTRVYGEEIAWHWRIRQAGWQIAVVAEAKITHFNVDKDITGWKLAEHRKGMLNYYCRYRPAWQAWILRVAIVFFHGLRCLYNSIFDRKRAEGDWLTVLVGLRWRPSNPVEN